VGSVFCIVGSLFSCPCSLWCVCVCVHVRLWGMVGWKWGGGGVLSGPTPLQGELSCLFPHQWLHMRVCCARLPRGLLQTLVRYLSVFHVDDVVHKGLVACMVIVALLMPIHVRISVSSALPVLCLCVCGEGIRACVPSMFRGPSLTFCLPRYPGEASRAAPRPPHPPPPTTVPPGRDLPPPRCSHGTSLAFPSRPLWRTA
jgi:hypothetical protein